MKLSRRQALALAAVALRAQEPEKLSPVLRAMVAELERSKQLRTIGANPLYFVEYTIDDASGYSVAATLGALVSERRSRFRAPQVRVRVGAPEFDNSNYVFSDLYFGSRFDPEQFPLDDDEAALRTALWLATDRAFKGAIEAIERKKAALRNVAQPEKLADLSAAPPVKWIEDVAAARVDEALWRRRAVSLSSLFSRFPEVNDSSVEIDSMQSAAYFANSEGSVTQTPDRLASVRIRAFGQAPDGMRVRDTLIVHAPRLEQLPGEVELQRAVESVGAHVKALVGAPVGEAYTGPILLEGVAAAQLFADFFGTGLAAQRRPVPEPGRPLPIPPGPLEGKIGSRVLPSGFTVVDDPTQKEWRGRPLMGTYAVDGEAVKPKPVAVIENGLLRALLGTRQPTKDTPTSNGRARVPGAFGTRSAAISNLFIQSAEPVAAADLRATMMKLVTAAGKPYGVIVRKLDFPSTASLGELRRFAANQERPISLPLLVYRVYADGREELVRGLRFRGLTLRSLRDILAASEELFAFDYLGNLAPLSISTGAGYVFPATVVAPSILLEEVELEPWEQDLPKLPLVPAPSLSQ